MELLNKLGLIAGKKINGEVIESVLTPKNYDLIIIETSANYYFRNYHNQPIKGSDFWVDFYLEPSSDNFFRKDQNGIWYDLEGHRLTTPIFLLDDILISLLTKKSKQSLSFRHQKIISSPHFGLIQIGKLVFDAKLDLVTFYGERVTGLGNKNIKFQNGKIIQEVHIGLNRKAFIDEENQRPFLIHDEIVTKHLQTLKKQKNHFEIFLTEENEYVVLSQTAQPVLCDHQLVAVDFTTYVNLGTKELVGCHLEKGMKYIDINSQATFHFPGEEDELVTFIDATSIEVNGSILRNVKTEHKEFVFNETQQTIFTLDEGKTIPNTIAILENFEKYFLHYTKNDELQIFDKKSLQTIDLQGFNTKIKNIISQPSLPLWNAIDENNNPIVIDARQGFHQLKIAEINGQRIIKVFDEAQKVGNSFLQNATLKTIAGAEKRVIDLTQNELKIYSLPADLKSNSINEEPSVYRNSPIHELDFSNPITINTEEFLVGKFIPFREDFSPIIIQKSNNRPIQLEGGGHKNEIVTGFNLETLETEYFIGEHRMIGSFTLTEDYKKEELVFSFQQQKSWLPFGDEFLPIFKRVLTVQNEKGWACCLFEIRDLGSKSEFVAVEINPPHRILVKGKGGKPAVKIFKGSDSLPKKPEDVSLMHRWFLGNPGILKALK